MVHGTSRRYRFFEYLEDEVSLLNTVPGVVEPKTDYISLHFPDKTVLVNLGVAGLVDREPDQVGCFDALCDCIFSNIQTPAIELVVLLLSEEVPLLLTEQAKRPR